jgi:hypothetical protein
MDFSHTKRSPLCTESCNGWSAPDNMRTARYHEGSTHCRIRIGCSPEYRPLYPASLTILASARRGHRHSPNVRAYIHHHLLELRLLSSFISSPSFLRSCSLTLFSAASSTFICSFLSALKPSSNSLCHGYKTKTWKPSAELATRKLVKEMVRVNLIVCGAVE